MRKESLQGELSLEQICRTGHTFFSVFVEQVVQAHVEALRLQVDCSSEMF